MSEFLKPQSPLQHKDGAYVYPLTTADQVILEDNTRLNAVLDNINDKIDNIDFDNIEGLENLVYASEGNQEDATATIDADTLDGKTEDMLSVAKAVNADKLNDKLPSYYAPATKLTPRNLLDNSDFRNPVNQRGQTSYSNGYTIDRWKSTNSNVNIIVGDGKITLSKSKTGGTFCQHLPFDVTGKRLTLAVNTSIGLLLHSFVSDGDDLPKIDGLSAYFGVKVSNGITDVLIYFNNSDTIEFDLYWAALYEGEYTAETLPEYQPKGYGAELAECQRYYYQSWTGDISDNAGKNYCGFIAAGRYTTPGAIQFPVTMRVTPTVTVLTHLGEIGSVRDWGSSTSIPNCVANGYAGADRVTIGCSSGSLTAGTGYAYHYTASADL